MIVANNFNIEQVPGIAKNATVHFYTSDPGIFTCTYPTGISGPPTVTAAGTRAWTVKNQTCTDGFNLPAAAAHATRIRDNCTIGFVVDTELLQNNPTLLAPEKYLVSNYLQYRRINWQLHTHRSGTTPGVYIGYTQSETSASNEAIVNFSNTLSFGQKYRVIITFSGTTLTRYLNNNTPENTLVRTQPVGEIDNPFCRMFSAGELYFWDSILSTDDIALWMAGSATSAAPVVAYGLDEETGQIAYDDSLNEYDSVFDLDANYPASQIVRSSTDTGFTSPLVEVPIMVAADCTAGVKNITLRRTRQGIPARVPALSDAELYDDGILPVTIVNPVNVVVSGPSQQIRTKLP